MHLLYLDDRRAPYLENFFGDEIPSYATLSHTWGPKGSEVTYEDIVKGTAAERKAGYAKIRFCREKAASHEYIVPPPPTMPFEKGGICRRKTTGVVT